MVYVTTGILFTADGVTVPYASETRNNGHVSWYKELGYCVL